jgi:DDE superfamily endonuclease
VAKVWASKKTVLPSEQDRSDIARKRARWKAYQRQIDPNRLVFIDETWAKTNMAPLRGWGLRGKRLKAKAPYGHWKTMTFLAALRHDRIDAPWVVDGPINGELFRLYVEKVLIPTLKPGDIVILDNLGSHKARPFAPRSGLPAQGCSSSRPIAPISTRSSRSSPSSNTSCARPPSGPLTRPGSALAPCSIAFYQTNAKPISPTQDTVLPEHIML